jgi:predicted kinase
MTRPALIAMCGLAFSGKSTMARRVAAALAAEIVSYDAINAGRGFDGGTTIADHEWEKTSLQAAEKARALLAEGRSVVVDDTFSHRFLRDRFRAVAGESGASFVLLFVDTPIAVIEVRIAENARTRRRGHIEAEVFAHHRDRFQFPAADEAPVRLSNEADLERWLAGARGDSKSS